METLHEAPIFRANLLDLATDSIRTRETPSQDSIDEALAQRQFRSNQKKLTLIIIVLWTIVQLIALLKNLFIYRILNEPLAYADQLIKRSIPWAAGILFIFIINSSTTYIRKYRVGLKQLPIIHFFVATIISIAIFIICFYSVQGLGLSTFGNTSKSSRAFSIYLLISITTTAHYYFHELRLKELALIKMEKAYQHSQIISLNNEVNPHMISNTLNNISSLISLDIDEAKKMIVDFAKLLRQNLKNKDAVYTTLIHEKRFINSYVNIQNSHNKKRYDIKFDFADDIQTAILPKMILQPLVENAIKHANPGGRKALKISIRAEKIDNHLWISVQNKTNAKQQNGTLNNIGIGTENIVRRLQVLYSNNFKFDIYHEQDHFTCELKIPFSQNETFSPA